MIGRPLGPGGRGARALVLVKRSLRITRPESARAKSRYAISWGMSRYVVVEGKVTMAG